MDRIKPAWFDRLAVGTLALATLQPPALALSIGWWFRTFDFDIALRLPVYPPATALLLTGIYLAPYSAAMFILGARREALSEQVNAWRVLNRTVAAITFAIAAIYIAASFKLFGPVRTWQIIQFWHWSVGILIVGSCAATLAYLRQLANYVRDRIGAQACEWLLLVPGLMVVFVIPGIAEVFLSSVGGIIRYFAIGYFPVSCGLFFRLFISFHRAARDSRTFWATESAQICE